MSGLMNNPLPRELAPGVFWLGNCLEQHYRGRSYHGYNSCYLVLGDRAALLVETGHPKDFPIIERQMGPILARHDVPLRHLFITHQETPHSGGLGRFLARHDGLTVHGDISDYHMAFPQFADRLRPMEVGDAIDLGGRMFMTAEPVVRDIGTTLWGFDAGERVLFPGDGFAYSHYHWDGHCGLVAEEATSLDLIETAAVFAELALFWTNFADMRLYVDRLYELIEELEVTLVAPTHGLPILDLAVTMPKVCEGLVGANREAAE
jgi:flavorubredoxin